MRWGISCEIEGDMDALGSILAVMKLKGAKEVGYEPLLNRKTELLPPPKGQKKRKMGRKTMMKDYIQKIPIGTIFGSQRLVDVLVARGYAPTSGMVNWIKAGLIKKIGYGRYQRI